MYSVLVGYQWMHHFVYVKMNIMGIQPHAEVRIPRIVPICITC